MSWNTWWSVVEGLKIDSESREGYFELTVTQERPNWFAVAFGLFFTAICFSIAAFLSQSSPPETAMVWFFRIFGVIGLLFCLGGAALTYFRGTTTKCLVSEGKLVWYAGSPLARRFDDSGEIDIASIDSMRSEYWHDETFCGYEFDLGGMKTRIKGSLGPALGDLHWGKEFREALTYWNPEITWTERLS